MAQPISPWAVAVHQGLQMGSGSVPLLIIAPVGALPVECAKEIHREVGGGTFERVICTPDSVELCVQVFGPTQVSDVDFPTFDDETPIGAIHRAAGGTLFLDYIDRCNPSDADWLRPLLAGRPVTFGGNTVELDPSTRIIASVTTSWAEHIEYAVPEWLTALFGDRVVAIVPLGHRREDLLAAIDWFSWRADPDGQSVEYLWSNEAKELLAKRQWPGGYGELWRFVRTLLTSIGKGGVITLAVIEGNLAKYESPGMNPIDSHRRQECHNYAHGMHYMGRPIDAKELYNWVEQFSRVPSDRAFDPWLVGLRIIKEIANKYYYSSDQLRVLIRNAYSSLCVELAENGYIPRSTKLDFDVSAPDLRALLVNPLGPIKSAAGVLPHIAHLLGAGSYQQVATVDNVAARLAADERIQVVLFCDDFAGTGQQILSQLVRTLRNDKVLRGLCENRYRVGKPVILGVVLAVGFAGALTKIRTSAPSWLPVFVHAGERLEESDRAFSQTSKVFPEPELRAWAKTLVVDEVGASLSTRWPGGFGDLQALVVTAENAPNDTLPAVWMSGAVHGLPWKALFERVSSPSG